MQLKDITITVTDPSGLVLFELSSEEINKERDKLIKEFPGDPVEDATPQEVAEEVYYEIKSLTRTENPLLVIDKIEQKSEPRRLFAFKVFSSMTFDNYADRGLKDLEELANGEGVIESKDYGVLLLQTSELIRQFAAAELMKRKDETERKAMSDESQLFREHLRVTGREW